MKTWLQWLRRQRCRLIQHGPIITCYIAENQKSHDYCEYCDEITKVHDYLNYLKWSYYKEYENFPEEYAPLYEDIRGKGKHP